MDQETVRNVVIAILLSRQKTYSAKGALLDLKRTYLNPDSKRKIERELVQSGVDVALIDSWRSFNIKTTTDDFGRFLLAIDNLQIVSGSKFRATAGFLLNKLVLNAKLLMVGSVVQTTEFHMALRKLRLTNRKYEKPWKSLLMTQLEKPVWEHLHENMLQCISDLPELESEMNESIDDAKVQFLLSLVKLGRMFMLVLNGATADTIGGGDTSSTFTMPSRVDAVKSVPHKSTAKSSMKTVAYEVHRTSGLSGVYNILKRTSENETMLQIIIKHLKSANNDILTPYIAIFEAYALLSDKQRSHVETVFPIVNLLKDNTVLNQLRKEIKILLARGGATDKGGTAQTNIKLNEALTAFNDIETCINTWIAYLDLKAPDYGIPGHGEHPAELGIREVVVDVLHCQSQVDPALEAQSHQPHGLRGHSDVPELPVSQAHGLELLAGGLQPDDVCEVAVQVVDGVGGPVGKLDGVAGLAPSVEHPQPDVGLELPELARGDLPLEQPIKVDGVVLLDVPPAQGGLELGAPAVDPGALSGAQAYEHVDAGGYPLYLESRAIQQDLTVRDPMQLRFDLLGIHP